MEKVSTVKHETRTAKLGLSWPASLAKAAKKRAREGDETVSRYLRRLVRQDLERGASRKPEATA